MLENRLTFVLYYGAIILVHPRRAVRREGEEAFRWERKKKQ